MSDAAAGGGAVGGGRDPAVAALLERLARPFDPGELKFKPQSVKGNRALALTYVDARLVADRLDEVVGGENWRDAYTLLPDGSVECRLSVRLGRWWVTKADCGSQSEQPDGGDRMKAAYSDALKRAAVKFGIGRYLYRLPQQWADYDPVKKRFVHSPPYQLPASAAPPRAAAAPAKKPPAAAGPAVNLPADGAELQRRLRDYDAKLAAQRLGGVGALLAHVTQAGVRAGYGADMTAWGGPAIPFAAEVVREYEDAVRRA